MTSVLRTWAEQAAAFARVLADQDPTWRSDTFGIGGGHAVLWGSGLYVNRALAAGLLDPMTASDFELLEHRSDSVGVPAAIEVTPATHEETTALASARGYVASGTTQAVRRRLDDVPPPSPSPVEVLPAADRIAEWQEVSAEAWGHHTPSARRASDAYARAAAVVDREGFVLAREEGRAVGVATLSVEGTIATLGSMATLPGDRGRGVQSALIAHRLRAAATAGCTIATSTTAPGSASERNLLRHGFERWFRVTTLVRESPDR